MKQLNASLNIERKSIVKTHKLKNDIGVICEMMAVGVDKNHQGKGIAKALTKLLLQNSKNKGFHISKAECTGLYSTKALVKAGGTVQNCIKYEEFTINGGCFKSNRKPFAGKVIEPHTEINLVVFHHYPEQK